MSGVGKAPARRTARERDLATRLLRIAVLAFGLIHLLLPASSVVLHGPGPIAGHGDGTEAIQIACLVCLGAAVALASACVGLVARRRGALLTALAFQLLLLSVAVQGRAHFERCMRAQDTNPPMRWSFPW